MKTLALAAASAVVLALTACQAAPVTGGESLSQLDASALESMRETLIKSEIIQLASAYGIARDSYDGEAYANVFTEDGKFHFRGEVFEGRDAIAGRVPAKTPDSGISMHFLSSSQVELTGPKTATGLHYSAVYVGEYPEGSERTGSVPGRLASQGIYTDSYRLTDDGWKIADRSYRTVFSN